MADVYVLGDGLPELAAALELAEVGLAVRVGIPDREEHDDTWGGLDDRGVRDPEGALRGLLDHVAAPLSEGERPTEAAMPVAVPPAPVLLRGAKGDWAPQPTPAVLGIPAVPLSSSALALLGGGAAMRAYLDRIRPVLTIGKTHALGALVRSRLGGAVLERLVEPLVRERYGVPADEVDVAIAAPGLNEALTVAGSLSGAALASSERDVARETRIAPRGGWPALRDALLARLSLYGATFSEEPATAVRRGGAEGDGRVTDDRDDDRMSEGWVIDEGGEQIAARALVVGVEGAHAAALVSESAGAPAELVPQRWRIEGIARIADPGLPVDHAGLPAVRTVTLADGEAWSVRIGGSGGTPVSRAAGPVLTSDRAGGEEARNRVREAIEAAGLRLEGGPVARVAVAPYASIEQRDAVAERLELARAEEPGLLPLGAALHGGELAPAVADARRAAVLLRRRLTGISE